MKKYSKISKCRICGNEELEKIGSLGNLAINDFPKTLEALSVSPKCPLELVLCKKCDLLQLGHNINPEELYGKFYWYKSATNSVIVQDLKKIVEQAIEIAKPEKGEVFLDIGANDGTLLSFVPKEYCTIGIEPAENLQGELNKNANHVCQDYWESKEVIPPHAKIITAIGMFYDSPNPNIFISKVRNYLSKDGIFIAQLMTLKPMIENNDVSNICHEHLEYYSYKSLKYFFEKNGLEIFKVEENNINGGSYRLFARHFKTGSIDYPEPEYDYKDFFERIERNKVETLKFIIRESLIGKRIYGYGASTKGNTILQYYGFNSSLLEGVIDIDPEKIGKYMLAGVPIVKEGEADYLFILPWGFTDEFIKKEKQLGYKGRFIISIPNFKII